MPRDRRRHPVSAEEIELLRRLIALRAARRGIAMPEIDVTKAPTVSERGQRILSWVSWIMLMCVAGLAPVIVVLEPGMPSKVLGVTSAVLGAIAGYIKAILPATAEMAARASHPQPAAPRPPVQP